MDVHRLFHQASVSEEVYQNSCPQKEDTILWIKSEESEMQSGHLAPQQDFESLSIAPESQHVSCSGVASLSQKHGNCKPVIRQLQPSYYSLFSHAPAQQLVPNNASIVPLYKPSMNWPLAVHHSSPQCRLATLPPTGTDMSVCTVPEQRDQQAIAIPSILPVPEPIDRFTGSTPPPSAATEEGNYSLWQPIRDSPRDESTNLAAIIESALDTVWSSSP